jgi:hypothetical protein
MAKPFSWDEEIKKVEHTGISIEEFTSKMSFETGLEYEKVFKVYDSSGKEFLRHTTGQNAPIVPKCDVEAVTRSASERNAKANQAMGGNCKKPDFLRFFANMNLPQGSLYLLWII